MEANATGKTGVGRWMQYIGGLSTILLLLPVPAFAGFTVTWGSLTTTNGSFSPFDDSLSAVDDEDPNLFRLVLKGGTFQPSSSFTSTLTATIVVTDSAVDLKATLSGLDKIHNLVGGTVSVEAGTTLIPTPNMFDVTSPFDGPSVDGTAYDLDVGIHTFTLQFTFTPSSSMSYSTRSTETMLIALDASGGS